MPQASFVSFTYFKGEALDALGVELFTQHLESCVLGHGSGSTHKSGNPMKQEELLAEVQTMLSRFLR